MINFKDFLIESKGADTAFSGHANEHLTHHLLQKYINHLKNSLQNGSNLESSHSAAMQHMLNQKYDPNKFSQIPELGNARAHFGDEEMGNMHEDSKKTASAIINHLRNNYNLGVSDSRHIGKENVGRSGGADLEISTQNDRGEPDKSKVYLEHLGASLKYAKSPSSTIKIHSPSVKTMSGIIDKHHQLMHGEKSGLQETLNNIGKEGVLSQQTALAKHHDVLSKYFNELGDKKLTYKPMMNSNGQVIGGNLSKHAVSHLRDSKDPKLRAAYNDMANENLKMKTRMAAALHDSISKILDHPSTSPEHDQIKESLIRDMANIHKDQAPSILVSTERNKPEASVYDTSDYLTKSITRNGLNGHSYSGKSTFKVGPMDLALDTRPTTSRNPVSSYPVNASIKTSDVKQNGSYPKTVETPPTTKKVKNSKSPTKPTPQQVAALKHQQTHPIFGNSTGEHSGTSFYSPADTEHAQNMQAQGAQ